MTTTKKRPTPTQLRQAFNRATKLSQILRLALHDLKLVERNRRYEVDMYSWVHKSLAGERCRVCLAGAVMVGRYQSACRLLNYDCVPSDFDDAEGLANKLNALNLLRFGDVRGAWMSMNPSKKIPRALPPYRNITDYEDGKQMWWKSMRSLVKELKDAGF